jgi:predicted transglutaminase-like cysteine proteinase
MQDGLAAQTETDDVIFGQRIVELGPILSPFQHVRFCQRYPADCRSNSDANQPIELNNKTLELLHRINRQVNTAIVPARKDYDGNVASSWAIAPKSGDCNDYAVTKQHELLRRNFPSNAVRLSEVKTLDGEGHLVLVVATTGGQLVLDNLTDEIRPPRETNYRWLKIQSKDDPRYWVAVKSPAVISAQLREAFRKMAIRARR